MSSEIIGTKFKIIIRYIVHGINQTDFIVQ